MAFLVLNLPKEDMLQIVCVTTLILSLTKARFYHTHRTEYCTPTICRILALTQMFLIQFTRAHRIQVLYDAHPCAVKRASLPDGIHPLSRDPRSLARILFAVVNVRPVVLPCAR
jgi:hypothetical protein